MNNYINKYYTEIISKMPDYMIKQLEEYNSSWNQVTFVKKPWKKKKTVKTEDQLFNERCGL